MLSRPPHPAAPRPAAAAPRASARRSATHRRPDSKHAGGYWRWSAAPAPRRAPPRPSGGPRSSARSRDCGGGRFRERMAGKCSKAHRKERNKVHNKQHSAPAHSGIKGGDAPQQHSAAQSLLRLGELPHIVRTQAFVADLRAARVLAAQNVRKLRLAHNLCRPVLLHECTRGAATKFAHVHGSVARCARHEVPKLRVAVAPFPKTRSPNAHFLPLSCRAPADAALHEGLRHPLLPILAHYPAPVPLAPPPPQCTHLAIINISTAVSKRLLAINTRSGELDLLRWNRRPRPRGQNLRGEARG